MPDDGTGPCRDANPVFVFYDRVGRDPAAASAVRQRRAVEKWLQDKGWRLTEAYVDTVPRTTPWADRPRARALLKDCTRWRPATTVVATGDAAQALGTGELWPTILLLARHGAQLWAPAFGGIADVTNAQHRHITEILSGIAPPEPARQRLARPRRRSGSNGQQRRSQPQQRRTQ